MKGTIGIIGLGIMGGAFARNLVAAGWKVIGYDIDAARNAEAKAAGVEIAHSAEAVAETASDIITSLPKPQAVLDTAEVIARANAKGRTVSRRPARSPSTTRWPSRRPWRRPATPRSTARCPAPARRRR